MAFMRSRVRLPSGPPTSSLRSVVGGPSARREAPSRLRRDERFRLPSGPPLLVFGSDFQQVAESRCGCAGSNKPISVERDSVRKEQLLEPLALLQRRLHPEVGGAR